MTPLFRRRLRRALLGLVLTVIALLVAAFVRVRYFPPRFDVISIATLPEYQNPALLARAWSLPVARSYLHELDFQPNGSVCGPTSVANAFRSLGEGPVTPHSVL